jgi:hypothetical protein
MPHDCWYCWLNRTILVVGMLAIAVVLFVAALDSAFHAHWLAAAKELFGMVIPFVGTWVGLRVLRAIPIAFDKYWPDENKAPWDQNSSNKGHEQN